MASSANLYLQFTRDPTNFYLQKSHNGDAHQQTTFNPVVALWKFCSDRQNHWCFLGVLLYENWLKVDNKTSNINVNKMLSCRRETALQGALLAKVEDWNWETIFYGHYYRSIFNHCDLISLQSYRIRWIKTQNKGYHAVQGHSSFKVIEVCTNQKPVCDLMINSNWHPISYCFGVIAAYWSNFGHCVFDPRLGWEGGS